MELGDPEFGSHRSKHITFKENKNEKENLLNFIEDSPKKEAINLEKDLLEMDFLSTPR